MPVFDLLMPSSGMGDAMSKSVVVRVCKLCGVESMRGRERKELRGKSILLRHQTSATFHFVARSSHLKEKPRNLTRSHIAPLDATARREKSRIWVKLQVSHRLQKRVPLNTIGFDVDNRYH